MNELSKQVAILAEYRHQFIMYDIRKNNEKENTNGRKIPCNYHTGKQISAHNPTRWTDFDTAANAALTNGGAK